jgi:hypothetical protein
MKKILKPQEKEEAVYYSDFTGKCFGDFYPPVELKLDFSYGSIYDGVNLKFDLDDEDVEFILKLLKNKLNQETKNNFKKMLKQIEDDYDNSVQFRDWENCEHLCNNKDLIKKII